MENTKIKDSFSKIKNGFDNHIEENLDAERVLDKFLKWLDSNKRLAFLLTLIVGIITHITMITETIMSQDGLWNSMGYNRPGLWEMTLGRWGIEIMQRFNFYIAIPTVSTISCVLIMAISAIFIVDLFDLKSKISVFFTAVFLAVTPTLTVTLLYIYTAFAYCSNFLIATLVIWFIYKFKYKKIGFIISTCLFMLVLSIYQSYIGVSVGLCIMLTIIDLIKGKKKLKEIFLNVLKTIVVVILGGLLYYGTTMILLEVNKLSLAEYKNLNSFKISDILINLWNDIKNCYRDFYDFYMKDRIIYNTNYRRDIFYGLFFIMFAAIAIINLVKVQADSKKIKYSKIVLVILLILVLPIGLNCINVLVVGNTLYALTSIQMILIIPFLFAMTEQIQKIALTKWIIILTCFYLVGTYYIADNASYASLKMRYNQAYAVSIRIMERLESTHGYDKNNPLCIGGIIGDNNYPNVSELTDYSIGSVFENPIFHGSYQGSIGTMHQFLKIFLGQDIAFCSDELYEYIVRSKEFEQLGNFPEDNCTAIISGVNVIKLSNYIPLPDGTLLFEEY